MNTEQIDQSSKHEDPVRVSGATQRKPTRRAIAVTLLIGAISFALGGCVTTDGYVGVPAYPDYSSDYGYYGYGGTPYYGYGGSYTQRVVVGGRRYSGGYGRHHFSSQRRGGNRPHTRGRHASKPRDYAVTAVTAADVVGGANACICAYIHNAQGRRRKCRRCEIPRAIARDP